MRSTQIRARRKRRVVRRTPTPSPGGGAGFTGGGVAPGELESEF